MTRWGSWCAPAASAVVIGCVGAGCGNVPEDADSGPTTTSVGDVESVPVMSPVNRPVLAELSVADGCAEVRLVVDGGMWGESCLELSPRVRAVVSETIDGVELVLLRFAADVELVGADPSSVAIEQTDGWALVESPTPDFTMMFRAGREEAVCSYNPFFVDCDAPAPG